MSENDKVNTGHNIENKELIVNARKPVGELGHQILDRMNKSHENMAQWGVSHFDIKEDDLILQITTGKVVGLDYSEVSVEKSIKLNKKSVDEGKVEVIQGSVSEMPFEDNTFDIITGFETIYFWPDFINDLKEVNRVLKKDGLLFFCNEAVYREGEMDKYDDLVELLDMKIYSEDVLKESLQKTGFKDFEAYTDDENDWICIIAKKE